MITDVNSEDRLVQRTFGEYLQEKVGWYSIYAWREETFGSGPLGLLRSAKPHGRCRVYEGLRLKSPSPSAECGEKCQTGFYP